MVALKQVVLDLADEDPCPEAEAGPEVGWAPAGERGAAEIAVVSI